MRTGTLALLSLPASVPRTGRAASRVGIGGALVLGVASSLARARGTKVVAGLGAMALAVHAVLASLGHPGVTAGVAGGVGATAVVLVLVRLVVRRRRGTVASTN